MPFLTRLDSRAAIRGSRDPLGVQPIWTRLGRRLVGNLTTVSTSVRDFTVTLLGYYLAERVADETGEADDLGVFLRWEQLAAYARGGRNGAWGFRGTERTRARWTSQERLTLGTDSESQILSDQKTYGLWGLYTVPSRNSGMLDGTPTRLSDQARRLIESVHLRHLGAGHRGAVDDVVRLLKEPRIELRPKNRHADLLDRVARTLGPRIERAEASFLHDHLVLGGPSDSTHGRQALLARGLALTELGTAWQLSPSTARDLARRCARFGGAHGEVVAGQLERIRAAESLLAPAVSLFGFVMSSRDQDLATLARDIRGHWPARLRTVERSALDAIRADFAGVGDAGTHADTWLGVADALHRGDYADAVDGLVRLNASVMAQRGGSAPWIELVDGRVRVKLSVEPSDLPDAKALAEHWIHPYFIESLHLVQLQLGVRP